MKRLIVILSCLITYIFCYGQNDGFSSIEEMIGKYVIIYDMHEIAAENGMVTYIKYNGKVGKAYTKIKAEGYFTDNKILYVEGIEEYKKKKYLHVTGDEVKDYTLLYIKNLEKGLHKVRSASYWSKWLMEHKEEYKYEYKGPANCVSLNSYKEIEWKNVQMPLNRYDQVVFVYKYRGEDKEYKILYNTLLHPNNFSWRTQEQYDEDEQRLESIAKVRDFILLPAAFKKDTDNGANKEDKIHEGDSVYIYKCVGDKVYFYFKEYDLSCSKSLLYIDDNEQLEYLQNRGERTVEDRKKMALAYSKVYAAKMKLRASLEEYFIEAAIEERINELNNKKLFLEEQDYEYGKYGDCGLKFRIYNCFKKTIKYIEFTCTPYNAVGDIQGDWVGKRVSKSKGIGPLEPGHSATWSWDNMFYDKNDIIRRIVLTNIKFTFMDGTTMVYSGKQNIDKHRQ